MQETEPKYFTKFKEELKGYIDHKLETHVPAYFTKFKEEFKEFRGNLDKKLEKIESKLESHSVKLEEIDNKLESHSVKLEEIDNKLESHFEEIGELKIQMTEIGMLLKHKASKDEVESIEHRTKKLEKVVFA